MKSTKTKPQDPAMEDGRRNRSKLNRQKIISAMLELVREGDFDPGAPRIAERAGVAHRTVYRHFEDVDSLYQEMALELEARLMPEVGTPLSAPDWPGRVKELMARRVRMFEEIMPVRTCASVRRFQSGCMMDDHDRFVSYETKGLSLALPKEILARENLTSAFDIALSFETWRRLRQDQKFSRTKATAVLDTLLDALIASA